MIFALRRCERSCLQCGIDEVCSRNGVVLAVKEKGMEFVSLRRSRRRMGAAR
jgi:hypothetical protein